MSRASTQLHHAARSIYKTLGLGNDSMAVVLLGTGFLTLLAIIGFYVPALAAALNSLMALVLGGGTFLGISILTGLNPMGLIFGALIGLLVAAISTTISVLVFALAPPIAAVLVGANIIAALTHAVGSLFELFEDCCGLGSRSSRGAEISVSTPLLDSYQLNLDSTIKALTTLAEKEKFNLFRCIDPVKTQEAPIIQTMASASPHQESFISLASSIPEDTFDLFHRKDPNPRSMKQDTTPGHMANPW